MENIMSQKKEEVVNKQNMKLLSQHFEMLLIHSPKYSLREGGQVLFTFNSLVGLFF
jgi:hypothetical protein